MDFYSYAKNTKFIGTSISLRKKSKNQVAIALGKIGNKQDCKACVTMHYDGPESEEQATEKMGRLRGRYDAK